MKKPVTAVLATLLLTGLAAGQWTFLDEEKVENEIHSQINDEREERGRKALKKDPELGMAARDHSWTMMEQWRLFHTENLLKTLRQNRPECWTFAENIAYTYSYGDEKSVAKDLTEMWMNSPPHRHYILQERFRLTGIGIVQAGPYVLATQNFCG